MHKSKLFKLVLKTLIVIIAYGYVFYKIKTMSVDWSFISIQSYTCLTFAILLMPVNWLLEAFKWRFLLRKVEKISVKRSLMGVFAGITTGQTTPNRIGEYFGRTVVLKKGNRLNGSLATIMGSMAQVIITISIGLIAFLMIFYQIYFFDKTYMKPLFIGLVVISLVLIILLYYHLDWLIQLSKWLKFKAKHTDKIVYLTQFNRRQLSYTIFLSLCRYVVFASQYILLLYTFGTQIDIIDALYSIGTIYLLILFIPHFFIAELGIRASVAVLVFQIYTSQIESVIMAASSLWIINLAITSVLGSFQFFSFPLKAKKTSD